MGPDGGQFLIWEGKGNGFSSVCQALNEKCNIASVHFYGRRIIAISLTGRFVCLCYTVLGYWLHLKLILISYQGQKWPPSRSHTDLFYLCEDRLVSQVTWTSNNVLTMQVKRTRSVSGSGKPEYQTRDVSRKWIYSTAGVQGVTAPPPHPPTRLQEPSQRPRRQRPGDRT